MTDVPHYFLYGETAPSDALDYLSIASLEESLPKHNWEIHPHRHDNMHQILVVEEGSVLVQINDQRADEKGHCIVSIPPKEIHGFVHQPGVRGYIITIAESFLRGVFTDSERQQFPFLFSDSQVIRIDTDSKASWDFELLIRQVMREYRKERPGQNCVIGAYLKILFVLMSRSCAPVESDTKQHNVKITLYEEYLKLLETNYKNHWSVSQYALALGLSSSRLNRLCQRYTGQNALQIVHERLVSEAKRMLIYANKSVNEIGYELGFKDPAYFSRFFTKHTDESPSKFKKRLRES